MTTISFLAPIEAIGHFIVKIAFLSTGCFVMLIAYKIYAKNQMGDPWVRPYSAKIR
jgi:hypothetical protein